MRDERMADTVRHGDLGLFRRVLSDARRFWPHVGLIFLVPGVEETLRVNGRAWIVRDEDLLARCEVRGKVPTLGIGVEVEEAFIHCAKAFKRSGLWEPTRWPDLSGLASPATMLHDQTRPPGVTVEDVDRALQESYTQRLY